MLTDCCLYVIKLLLQQQEYSFTETINVSILDQVIFGFVVRFSNRLLINYGKIATELGAGKHKSVTFPKTFSALYIILVTKYDPTHTSAGFWSIRVTEYSVSSFTGLFDANPSCFWLALGY